MVLPAGIRFTRVTNQTLSEMLASGELDCVFAATPPNAFGRHPDVVRLFPEVRKMDKLLRGQARILDSDQQPVPAVMQTALEKSRAAIAECREKRLRKELASYRSRRSAPVRKFSPRGGRRTIRIWT